MADVPGNSTATGQGVFNANLDLGKFSLDNRRRFLDGVAQSAPPAPTLLQLQTTLTAGDTDTYKIQWQGPSRRLTASIQGGTFELYRHPAITAAPCYPDIKGGRCNTTYIVTCRCYSITQQRLVQADTVANGPIAGIGFYFVGGKQGIYVSNTAGQLAIAWAWDNQIASDPIILSVKTFSEDPDNCGNIPGYCPKYPGKIPKNATNTFPLSPNDFLYAQIKGTAGQATLKFS